MSALDPGNQPDPSEQEPLEGLKSHEQASVENAAPAQPESAPVPASKTPAGADTGSARALKPALKLQPQAPTPQPPAAAESPPATEAPQNLSTESPAATPTPEEPVAEQPVAAAPQPAPALTPQKPTITPSATEPQAATSAQPSASTPEANTPTPEAPSSDSAANKPKLSKPSETRGLPDLPPLDPVPKKKRESLTPTLFSGTTPEKKLADDIDTASEPNPAFAPDAATAPGAGETPATPPPAASTSLPGTRVAGPPSNTSPSTPRFEIRKGPPRPGIAKGVTLPPINHSRPPVGEEAAAQSAVPPAPSTGGTAPPTGTTAEDLSSLSDLVDPPRPEPVEETGGGFAGIDSSAATAPEAEGKRGLKVRKQNTEAPPVIEEAGELASAGAKKSSAKGGLIFVAILLLLLGVGGASMYYGLDKVIDSFKEVAGGTTSSGDASDRGPETRDANGSESEPDPFAAVSSPVLAMEQAVQNNDRANENVAQINKILRSGEQGQRPTRTLTQNSTQPRNGDTPDPATVTEAPAPPPAPVQRLKPQPEVVHYLRSLHITGVFMTGSGSAKMMVDGQVYLLGQTINPDLGLRWIDYRKDEGRLVFQDDRGMGYVKKY
ncbi:MAG: hypothetical protein ACFBZ8_11285 [Opitutales bacterium]